MTMSLTD